MTHHENPSEARPPELKSETGTAAASQDFAVRDRSRGRAPGPVFLCGMGLLGGCVAWALVDRFGETFKIPAALAARYGEVAGGNQETARQFKEAGRVVRYKNTALAMGLFGAAFVGCLGFGAGISRKSATALIALVPAGIGLGALFGILGGATGVALDEQIDRFGGIEPPFRTMMLHATLWIVIGFSAGLVVGNGLASVPMGRALGASFAAALVAGLLYAPLAAVLFPMDNADLLVPRGTWNRLFWTLLPSGLIGIALGRSGSRGVA